MPTSTSATPATTTGVLVPAVTKLATVPTATNNPPPTITRPLIAIPAIAAAMVVSRSLIELFSEASAPDHRQ